MFLLEASVAVLAIAIVVLSLAMIKIVNWIKNLEWFIQQQFKISRNLKDVILDMKEDK